MISTAQKTTLYNKTYINNTPKEAFLCSDTFYCFIIRQCGISFYFFWQLAQADKEIRHDIEVDKRKDKLLLPFYNSH